MEDINIIDNYMDEREFRNYIIPFLEKEGFTNIRIDDTRTADLNDYNNNDLTGCKDENEYTIRALANYAITKKEVNDTVNDMYNENVSFAIILTNTAVDDETVEYAKQNNITIYDRKYFTK